ncbi:hypothetical protein BJX99DRAFT_226330 [Aspergillus californicus]
MILTKFPLLSLWAFPRALFAQECPTTTTGNALAVSSPADLDVFSDCTSITGDIAIDNAFSGSFVLNGVTNFTGSIYMPSPEDSHDMDAFEMLDLTYIERLDFAGAWGLKSVQLPLLEHVEQLYFIQDGGESSFDVGALKSAGNIAVAGDWTNITFPSLETVTGDFTIATDPSWTIPDSRASPMEIYLPLLREAHFVSISGHVSRLETPSLEALGTSDQGGEQGIEVYAEYTDLSGVYLSSLKSLYGSISLYGHIAAVNLNGMSETNGTITIRATSPVEIYSGLQEAGTINLSGSLSAINFEDIFHADELNINSDVVSECPISLIEVYREVNAPNEATFCNSGSLSRAGDNPYSETGNTGPTVTGSTSPSWEDLNSDSDSDSGSGSGRPSTGIIVMIPLLVGVGACGSIYLFAKWRGRKMRRQDAAWGDTTGTPMQDMSHRARPRPRPQEQQGHRPRVLETGVSDIDDAPPPPYSKEPPK